MATFLPLIAIVLTAVAGVLASDPDMLQDICVADNATGVKVNGFPCKDDARVSADDFSFSGLAQIGSFNKLLGSVVTPANVGQVPGLNTLGVSMARVDFQPGGVNPPHTHPRGTEMIFVLEGELLVGFITTANKLISKTIKKGDNFVFPRGLVHFQRNVGAQVSSVIAAFNSQLPGTQQVAATLFASNPPVPDNVLQTAFQINGAQVNQIRNKLAP